MWDVWSEGKVFRAKQSKEVCSFNRASPANPYSQQTVESCGGTASFKSCSFALHTTSRWLQALLIPNLVCQSAKIILHFCDFILCRKHFETMSGTSKSILVFLGSTRDGRQGLRVARMFMSHLSEQGLVPTLIDPLEINAPLLTNPIHFMPDQSAAPEWLKKLDLQIKEAVGFVFVCPEYNATVAPALTNLIDYFPPASYRHKPASIATYSMGTMGGCRARVALLPVLGEVGMFALPTSLMIPTIQNAEISDDGTTNNERVVSKVTQICKEMDWYVGALQSQKAATDGYPN